ncbi:MAG: GAF domain-containing protein [Anaerolineaceae bacterium]|nr:GAF domain-containing protein [Anaerolineaceae bacterium]
MTALSTSPTPPHLSTLDQLRRRYLVVLAWFWVLSALVGVIIEVTNEGIAPFAIIVTVIVLVINLFVLWLIQNNHFTGAVTLFLITLVPTVLSSPDALVLTGTLAVLSAAVLGNRWTFLLIYLVTIGRIVFLILEYVNQHINGMNIEALNSMLLLLVVGLVGIAVRVFVEAANRATREAHRTTQLLTDTASIGQELAQILQLDELLPQAVELIRQRFAFYHVQVFLVDDLYEYANLAASTGAVGRELLARHHRLAVGSQSVIGQTTKEKRPVIARYTDAVYYSNELLPDTRSELSLPIMDGERVVGALDVQSRDVQAFQTEDIQALQALANLLATSIRNARLFAEQSQIAEETKRMFLESETNLREIQRLNRQATRQGWQDYWRERRMVNGLTLDNQQLIPNAEWSENQIKAARTRRPVQSGDTVSAPIMLGNEVIGALEVEAGGDMPESEAMEIVNAVAQRLALSLDKSRLFEESQDIAAQEQRINEISTHYQAVANVDDLLRITLTELSQSLGAKRGAIRLGGQHPDHQNGNGSSGT